MKFAIGDFFVSESFGDHNQVGGIFIFAMDGDKGKTRKW